MALSLNFSGSMDNSTVRPCKFYWAEFVGYFYIQTIICFVGVWLNLLCLLVFHKKPFHRVVHYFMAALAFFDLLTLFIILPQGFIRCSDSTDFFFSICQTDGFKSIRLVLYLFTIYFGFPVSNITEFMSIFIILIITWERYQVMKGSCQFNVKPVSHIYSNLLVLFFISVVLNIPFFFVQENIEIKYTVVNKSHVRNFTTLKTIYTSFGKSNVYRTYLWLRMVVIPIVILLIVTVISILLIKVTHRSFKSYSMIVKAETNINLSLMNNNRQINTILSRRLEIEIQLTSLLILLIFLFILGQFPQAFSFTQLYEKITWAHNPPERIECRSDYKLYKMIAYFLSLCTYGFPFFIYIAFDGSFRRTLLAILRCRKSSDDENLYFIESQETFNLTTIKKDTQSKKDVTTTIIAS